MAGTAELSVVIKAKDETSKGINSVKSSLGGLSGMAKTATIGIGALGVGLGAAAAVGFSFAKAAAEEQASISRLNQSIANLGGNTADMVKQSEAAIKAAEKLAFSDDEARSSLALLVAQTGDYTDAQHRLTVAQNLARGANLDLETASRLVGKITEENVQVLKRYGITLRDGATETEALEEIQKRFGGQAQTFAESGAGGWQRFNNELQNVKESIGVGLLPLFSMASKALADFLAEHQDDIERLSVAFGEKLAGAIESVVTFFITHKETINGFWQSFKTGLETIRPLFEFIINNKPVLVAAILAIGVAIVVALGPGAAAVIAIVGLITLIGYLRDNWREVLDAIRGYLEGFVGWLRDHWVPILIGVLTGPAGLAIYTFRDEIKGALDSIVGYFQALPGKIMSAISGLGGKIAAELNPLNHVPGGGLAQDIIRGAGGLFGFAKGGMVPGYPGQPRLAVVHGGEQVLTPAQQQRGMAAGPSFTFNITADPGWSDQQMRRFAGVLKEEFNVGLRLTSLQGTVTGGGLFA